MHETGHVPVLTKFQNMQQKILIEVRDGNVNFIASTLPGIEIVLIDYDNMEASHAKGEQYEPEWSLDKVMSHAEMEIYVAQQVPTLYGGQEHRPEEILRVVDINRATLKTDTVDYLKALSPVYLDTSNSEHIYHVNDILENIERGFFLEPSEEVKEELEMMATMINRCEAGYIRLTKND